MRAIIIGAGDVGMPIIHYLGQRGNLLTVMDKNEEHCKHISNHSDAAIFCCSGDTQDIWKTAEAENADLLMALTNDDALNEEVSRMAKRDYGIPFVIARAHQPENLERMKEAGADIAICPSQETVRTFINALESRSIQSVYESQQQKFKIAIVTIPSNATAIGKNLSQIENSAKCKIPNILRNGSIIFPDESLILKGGDKIIITGSKESVEKTAEKLRIVETT